MSWGYAKRLEEQLRVEVKELLKAAEEAGDQEPVAGLKVGEEVAIRQARLEPIGAAKAELEARAQARYEVEKAAYEAKQAQRRERELGHKLGGRAPQPPEPGPRDSDQVNFTDPESRIMPMCGGGFEQCYNAQACVDQGSRLIVARGVGLSWRLWGQILFRINTGAGCLQGFGVDIGAVHPRLEAAQTLAENFTEQDRH